METVAVLDFETTGLSPGMGDRATEIAIALVREGQVVDRFQSLMNAGCHIPYEITALTGITNAMIASAPPASKVMREAALFVGRHPVVAHNAAFDRRFWQAELERIGLQHGSAFACTLLLARRIYPQSRNHRLSTLVQLLGLPRTGRAHRAMVDTEMTCHLWSRIRSDVSAAYAIGEVDHDLLMRVQSVSRAQVPRFLRDKCRAAGGAQASMPGAAPAGR